MVRVALEPCCVLYGPLEALVVPNVNVAALNVSVCISTVTSGVGEPCTRPFCAVLVLLMHIICLVIQWFSLL